MRRFNDGRDWFFENRFGMFVTWGLYAIDAWHEQIQWRRLIPKAEYVKRIQLFNPIKFDPNQWLDLLTNAGMQYITFTTKHHDGFCMWDTKYTEYNIMNTPYGRDVLKILANACHDRGIRLCLYYSCPDWHQMHSVNQGGDHQLERPNPGDEPDNMKYIEYVRNQVRELCTSYGRISGFWWDIPPEHHDPSFNGMLRELQPGIIINDRGYDKGDYDTPERHVPEGKKPFTRATEACQSVGRESWGYREHEDYYSHKFIMHSMSKIMAMGGNYLLNVGPMADGTIPDDSADTIRSVGKWYMKVREGLCAEPYSDIVNNDNIMITRRENMLYVIFHKDPQNSGIVLAPLDIKPARAILINTGKVLDTCVEIVPTGWKAQPYLHIQGLPVNELSNEVMVVRVEFDRLDNGILRDLQQKALK